MPKSECISNLRLPAVASLIQYAYQLQVKPVVKYTALSLFADRFYPLLTRSVQGNDKAHWLLQPIRESNLQLFSIVSIWISSKIHESRPLSVKSLKSLGDKIIREQHFTTRDFFEAEVIFLQVLHFEIGAGNIAFTFLEELLLQFKAASKVGELINFEACMDIMDLLYEKEEQTMLYNFPLHIAASTLVASYVITVPKQKWEFPVLSWAFRLNGKTLFEKASQSTKVDRLAMYSTGRDTPQSPLLNLSETVKDLALIFNLRLCGKWLEPTCQQIPKLLDNNARINIL